MKKKYLAIVNPISGIGEKGSVLPMLSEAFSNDEQQIYFVFTHKEKDAERFAKEAIHEGYDSVIAVGGDGTINQIAGVLYNSTVKLGVIPKGSGNGMARSLGIPISNDQAAIEVIKKGHTRAIDTSFANGIPFFCTFGVGFDAGVTKRYAEASTRGIFTYFRSAVDEYIHFKPKRYTITASGKRFEREAMLITCANIDQYGSNTYIAPGAMPDDGLLDLVIISPISLIETPKLAVQLFTKRVDDNANVESLRCANITIERKEAGSVQIDGESLEMGREIKIKVVPQSLHIYAPEVQPDEPKDS